MTSGEEEPRSTRDQLTAIATAFGRLGIPDRADRLRLLADAVGRPLHSSSRLTYDEAETIKVRLRTAKPPAMRAHLARLVHAEEQAARRYAAAPPAAACLATWCEDDTCTGTHTDTPLDPIDQAVAVLRDAGLISQEP